MKRIIYIFVAIAICFGIGYSAQIFQAHSLATWYPTLDKSVLTPPNEAFPIAWGIIYICSGISIGLVWDKQTMLDTGLGWLFFLQLIFNFAWSVLFFYLQDPLSGLIDIALLDLTVIFYTLTCYRINRFASLLFIPYLIWSLFATYLTIGIYILN